MDQFPNKLTTDHCLPLQKNKDNAESLEPPETTETQAAALTEPANEQDKAPSPPAGDSPVASPLEGEVVECVFLAGDGEEPVAPPAVDGKESTAPPVGEEDTAESSKKTEDKTTVSDVCYYYPQCS